MLLMVLYGACSCLSLHFWFKNLRKSAGILEIDGSARENTRFLNVRSEILNQAESTIQQEFWHNRCGEMTVLRKGGGIGVSLDRQ